MLITFYGQLIFDRGLNKKGVEILVRGERVEESLEVAAPAEIFSQTEFGDKYRFALDMQILTAISMISQEISRSCLDYVFINVTDYLLKELIIGDSESMPFSSLETISRKIAPAKLVIEVSEVSTVRVEHLCAISARLRKSGVLVAQDDFNQSRDPFLCSGWDFVKINTDELVTPELKQHTAPIVVERATKECLLSCKGELFQGFELHKPEDILSLIFSCERRSG